MKDGFKPLLLRVEASADMVNPDEMFWITSWWQNVGDGPSQKPLDAYVDMVFGNQRIPEDKIRKRRYYWRPYPGTNCVHPGEIMATTFIWKVERNWGGTFHLQLGIESCGDPVYAGDLDIGWTWGQPAMEQQRRAWSRSINNHVKMEIVRPAPDHKWQRISDGSIEAEISLAQPLLRAVGNGSSIFAGTSTAPFAAIRHVASNRTVYSSQYEPSICWETEHVSGNSVTYKGRIAVDEVERADLTIEIEASKGRLAVTLKDVSEKDGWEFLQLTWPVITGVSGESARLIDLFEGGRLIVPSSTPPCGFEHPYDIRNVAVIMNDSAMLVMESDQLDNKVATAVICDGEEKSAAMGATLGWRVPADKAGLESIKVMSDPCLYMEMPDTSYGKPSWQAAARFLRRGLSQKRKNRDVYRGAVFYKFGVSSGPEPEPGRIKEDSPYPIKRLGDTHTFDDSLDCVRKVRNLTDGIRQIMYIAGWEYEGFDTGYPYIKETDPRAGTVEDLRRVIAEGPEYNAVIGMHDNFDDCYISPHLDWDVVAMNERGEPFRGWLWAGGMSYMTAFAHYAYSGKMQQRVKDTVDIYGINTSYHLDVLTSEVRRYDFTPGRQAAADENLKAKVALVEEFNRYGIDLSSEVLSHPFVGVIGYALHVRSAKDVLYPGEKQIPLVYMIYHGIIQYSGGGDGRQGILSGLLSGASGRSGIRTDEGVTEAEFAAIHYLQTLPVGMLYDKYIEDYREAEGTVEVVYGDKSWVRKDATGCYEVVVDGRLISRDWTTFAPGNKPGTWLAFSLDGGTIEYALPEEWKGLQTASGVTLTVDGEGGPVPCRIEGGRIFVDLTAGVPARITAE